MNSESEFFFGRRAAVGPVASVRCDVVVSPAIADNPHGYDKKSRRLFSNGMSDEDVLDGRRRKILKCNPQLIVEVFNFCRNPTLNRIISLPVTDETPEGCPEVRAFWNLDCLFRVVPNPEYVLEPSDPKP